MTDPALLSVRVDLVFEGPTDQLEKLHELFTEVSAHFPGITAVGDVTKTIGKPAILSMSIDDFIGSSNERVYNCLRRAGIETVGMLIDKTPDDLLGITNFNDRFLEDVMQKLASRGLSLRED